MFKLVLIFFAFGIGAILGYYIPFGLWNTDLEGTPSPNNLEILTEKNNYRQNRIKGIIESINQKNGVMVIFYSPRYALLGRKSIKLNFDKGVHVRVTKIERRGGNVIFWEHFPDKYGANLLASGDIIEVTFRYNEERKILLVESASLDKPASSI